MKTVPINGEINSFKQRSYWLLGGGLVLLALVGIVLAYQGRSQDYRQQVENRLRLVGEVQNKNVVAWRRKRMADAGALTEDPLLAHALTDWLHSRRQDPELEQMLLQRLQVLVEFEEYALVRLLDTEGRVLLGTDTITANDLPHQEMQALTQALAQGSPVTVEPQALGYFAFPFFSVMAPLYDGVKSIGVVWLVIDLRTSLYSLLQAWQLESPSAEVVLVQRHGDKNIININPLPKSGVLPLSKALPLTRTESPGIQAMRGARGVVRGLNHKDRPIVAMVSAIDGAPWWLTLQIDEAEVVGDARRREGLAFGLLVGGVLFSTALLGGIWQWTAWRTERALKRELELNIRWLDSAQHAAALGYFIYDLHKEQFFISAATAQIFGVDQGGWFSLERWASLVIPEDKKQVLMAHERAISQSEHLHVQYRIYREDTGQQRWIQVWAEVDNQTHGQAGRMIGIAQDITERKNADAQLEEYRHQLESQVRLDPLTGIANRLALEEALHKEWRRAARHAQPVALLMLDLDHFKTYNDTYGHVQGDACLRQVAQVLAASVGREGEMVARYGGEEFTVLLPGASLAQAEVFGQHLVQAVCSLALPHAGTSVAGGIVTISVGVACAQPGKHLTQDQAGITALVQCADQALYAAKQAGRNRCAVADSVPQAAA